MSFKYYLPIGFFFLIIFSSCKNSPQADAVFYNGQVYTVDSAFTVVTAFAVTDGKIIATGTDADIIQFEAKQKTDLQGKTVYPGFHDAHCHFYGYGTDLTKIWLVGTPSFKAIVDTLQKHPEKRSGNWIFGRGWDQNDWEDKSYPDNTLLDSLWPDTPVFLLRIDGHAAIANSTALKLANIDASTAVTGGEIRKRGNKLTGLLIDAAVDLVHAVVPKPEPQAQITALLAAQSDCFAVGLTHVTDAGIEDGGLRHDIILRIDSLQKTGMLSMRMNIMAHISETSAYIGKPRIKSSGLSVTGFKMYADGALGSRGACLLSPYSDQPGHTGFLIGSAARFDSVAKLIAATDYQLNTHCIGDSSHRLMLQIYNNYLKGSSDRRWRIEHAQVIDTADLHYYRISKIIPSVQPVHATSDMYWAEDRLGPERVKGAYAYKMLLEQNGMIAAGSDFPVEYINPLFGYYAAVARKDQKGFPENGFQKDQSLTREQALRAMTIWAAYAAFNEKETGSIEVGKYADFVILDSDLMTVPEEQLWNAKVLETYLNGKNVYRRTP
jgi:predicted amidohydrolase YtcJ